MLAVKLKDGSELSVCLRHRGGQFESIVLDYMNSNI